MDLMDIRRSLLMILTGGEDMGNWNKKQVTVPNNISTTTELKTWLLTDGVVPSCDYGIIIIDKDTSEWEPHDFVIAPILHGLVVMLENNVNGWFVRNRGTKAQNNQYYQQRGFQNEETVLAYQGDTFTIFYQ